MLGLSTLSTTGQTTTSNEIIVFDVNLLADRLAIGYRDRSVNILEASTQDNLLTIPEPSFAVGADTNISYVLRDIAFNSNGDKIAVTYGGLQLWGLLRIYDVSTGQLLTEFEVGSEAYVLDWNSHDDIISVRFNTTLGSSPSMYVGVWDIDTNVMMTEISLSELGASLRSGLSWSSDGNRLAVNAGDIYLFDTTTWQQSLVIPSQNTGIGSLLWSPSGDFIAGVNGLGTIFIFDAEVGMEAQTFAGSDEETRLQSFSWSPLGDAIAVTTNNGTQIQVWDIATGNVSVLVDIEDMLTQLLWAEDNQIYYTTRLSEQINILDVDLLITSDE